MFPASLDVNNFSNARNASLPPAQRERLCRCDLLKMTSPECRAGIFDEGGRVASRSRPPHRGSSMKLVSAIATTASLVRPPELNFEKFASTLRPSASVRLDSAQMSCATKHGSALVWKTFRAVRRSAAPRHTSRPDSPITTTPDAPASDAPKATSYACYFADEPPVHRGLQSKPTANCRRLPLLRQKSEDDRLNNSQVLLATRTLTKQMGQRPTHQGFEKSSRTMGGPTR